MKEEIKELIKKHLPEQTAGALKERLEDLECTEVEYNTMRPAYEKLLALKLKESDLEKQQEAIDKDRGELRKSISENKAKREALDVERRLYELEVSLACEQEKSQFTKEVALGLVRNTSYRSSVLENKTEYITDSNGYTAPWTANDSKTETRDAD